MRILVNGLFLIPNRVGGSETYLRGLLSALSQVDRENEYVLCVGPEAADTFTRLNDGWRVTVSPMGSTWRPGRLALEQTWLPRVASVVRADILHSTGYTAPLMSDAIRITNIHDMNYKRHPEDLAVSERLVYTTLIPLVARRSKRILALTESARSDILRWTPARPAQVVVAHAGVRTLWPGDPRLDHVRLTEAGVKEPYIVTVAAAYPHKNLRRLVTAFPLRTRNEEQVRLVLVGLRGRADHAIRRAMAGREPLISILGWVDDALLASLYRRAVALAFPSLYEGFGLPILEAMSLGTPVVTSGFGAMAEVAEDAAELVDPYDVGSIRAGLERVVNDQRRRDELSERGLQRAAQFSWTETARRTLAVYADALKR